MKRSLSTEFLTCSSARFFFLALGLFAVADLWAASPRVSLDRSKIFEGESVTLMIEIDENAQTSSPDVEPLKTDFHILGQSSSTQLQVSGGKQIAITKWLIELVPKRTGVVRIPPVSIGSNITSSLSLQVLEQQARDSQQGAQDIFLEVEVEPENPYVQSQVRYTVRLFYAIRLLEGNLDPPSSPDAVIEQLGDDVSYVAVRHGRRYQVFERRYAIFPEKSGELILPPPIFIGRAAASGSARSWTERFFNQGRRLRLSGKPVAVDVRPRPSNSQGNQWLPAEELALREAWPKEPPAFRAGEPVTRTVILEAKGLNATQLPALPMPDIPGVRMYPDQPVTKNRVEEAGMVGRIEQRVAVIPNEAGEFTLPEVRIPWWDTKAEKQRIAVLPARTITVLPGIGAPQPIIPKAALEPGPISKPTGATGDVKAVGPAAGFWPWISVTLLVLWLLTVLGWWRERRGRMASKKAKPELPVLGEARRALRRACRENDAAGAAQALLDWAAVVWPTNPPKSLGAVAARLTTDATPIWELDRALYAPALAPWENGTALWECAQRGLAKNRETARPQTPGLPPLYPERV